MMHGLNRKVIFVNSPEGYNMSAWFISFNVLNGGCPAQTGPRGILIIILWLIGDLAVLWPIGMSILFHLWFTVYDNNRPTPNFVAI